MEPTNHNSNKNSTYLDRGYEKAIIELVEKIKSNDEEEIFQPLSPIQDFFSTLQKIKSLEIKDRIILTAFLEFSSQSNVQWIALKIAKEETQSNNTYFYNLIEACKKTNSKEIAIKAAEELEIPLGKKICIIKDLSDHFNSL